VSPTAEVADSAHADLRVAFVGQSVYFRQCSLLFPSGGLQPAFLDFRAAAPPQPLLARLQEFDPDVVLVFRPEIIPAGLFDSLRATAIGYITEPLPRGNSSDHTDLRERLGWLMLVDPGNFDRIVSFDPLIAETASSVLPVWRSLPIPVADSLFMDLHERGCPPRLLFVAPNLVKAIRDMDVDSDSFLRSLAFQLDPSLASKSFHDTHSALDWLRRHALGLPLGESVLFRR